MLAIVNDWNVANEFHDKERPSCLRRASVEHPGNIRMIHQRHRLPCSLKSHHDGLHVHGELDHLERDLSPDRFLQFREINHPAAAAFA